MATTGRYHQNAGTLADNEKAFAFAYDADTEQSFKKDMSKSEVDALVGEKGYFTWAASKCFGKNHWVTRCVDRYDPTYFIIDDGVGKVANSANQLSTFGKVATATATVAGACFGCGLLAGGATAALASKRTGMFTKILGTATVAAGVIGGALTSPIIAGVAATSLAGATIAAYNFEEDPTAVKGSLTREQAKKCHLYVVTDTQIRRFVPQSRSQGYSGQVQYEELDRGQYEALFSSLGNAVTKAFIQAAKGNYASAFHDVRETAKEVAKIQSSPSSARRTKLLARAERKLALAEERLALSYRILDEEITLRATKLRELYPEVDAEQLVNVKELDKDLYDAILVRGEHDISEAVLATLPDVPKKSDYYSTEAGAYVNPSDMKRHAADIWGLYIQTKKFFGTPIGSRIPAAIRNTKMTEIVTALREYDGLYTDALKKAYAEHLGFDDHAANALVAGFNAETVGQPLTPAEYAREFQRLFQDPRVVYPPKDFLARAGEKRRAAIEFAFEMKRGVAKEQAKPSILELIPAAVKKLFVTKPRITRRKISAKEAEAIRKKGLAKMLEGVEIVSDPSPLHGIVRQFQHEVPGTELDGIAEYALPDRYSDLYMVNINRAIKFMTSEGQDATSRWKTLSQAAESMTTKGATFPLGVSAHQLETMIQELERETPYSFRGGHEHNLDVYMQGLTALYQAQKSKWFDRAAGKTVSNYNSARDELEKFYSTVYSAKIAQKQKAIEEAITFLNAQANAGTLTTQSFAAQMLQISKLRDEALAILAELETKIGTIDDAKKLTGVLKTLKRKVDGSGPQSMFAGLMAPGSALATHITEQTNVANPGSFAQSLNTFLGAAGPAGYRGPQPHNRPENIEMTRNYPVDGTWGTLVATNAALFAGFETAATTLAADTHPVSGRDAGLIRKIGDLDTEYAQANQRIQALKEKRDQYRAYLIAQQLAQGKSLSQEVWNKLLSMNLRIEYAERAISQALRVFSRRPQFDRCIRTLETVDLSDRVQRAMEARTHVDVYTRMGEVRAELLAQVEALTRLSLATTITGSHLTALQERIEQVNAQIDAFNEKAQIIESILGNNASTDQIAEKVADVE